MARFAVLQAGDGDHESGGHDRTPLRYRGKRDLKRSKDHVNTALELYLDQLAAVNEAKHHELDGIQDVGRHAYETAREGRIQAELTLGSVNRLNTALEILGFNFLRELNDS